MHVAELGLWAVGEQWKGGGWVLRYFYLSFGGGIIALSLFLSGS